MSWFQKPSPQDQLEARLLGQARAARLEVWLQNLPLEFLLAHQCRHLEGTAAANLAKTDLSQDPPKLMQRIKSKTQRANALLALLKNWLIRRPCLQPLRVACIQFRRRLMVKALSLVLRLLFKLSRSRGTRPPSAPCSKSLSKPANKAVSNDVVREQLQSACLIELSRRLPLGLFTQEAPSVLWLYQDPARQQR
jgi:hypothetical protein